MNHKRMKLSLEQEIEEEAKIPVWKSAAGMSSVLCEETFQHKMDALM
jgi:hypothetical protein